MMRFVLDFGPLTFRRRLRFMWAVLRGRSVTIEGQGERAPVPAPLASTTAEFLN